MKNVGTIDKVVRLVVSAALVGAAVYGKVTGLAAIVCYVLAAVFTVTSLVSMCPLYSIFRIRTCNIEGTK